MTPITLGSLFSASLLMLMLLPATAAHANYYPRGTPDLTVILSKTYPDTIRLDSRNYTMLLSEIDKLPVLLNGTLLPKMIELLLDNKEKFLRPVRRICKQ